MCKQLFNRKYVIRNFGKERASFGKKANMAFGDLGKYVLGGEKVVIDNLWFIGHFYHDASPQYKCKIREGAKIVDYPLLENVMDKLSESCPFSKYGCSRSV